jgi:glycosyltransferase involved in cell wall biosynthesis
MSHPHIIITAPSLDPTQNVSGVSTVVQFIIENNKEREYQHFQIGKTDKESGGAMRRLLRIWKCYGEWRLTLTGTDKEDNQDNKDNLKSKQREERKTIIHYSFPLSAPSILRDPWFMHYALKKGYKMVVHVHGGLFLTAPRIPFLLEKILKWVFSWDVPFIVLSEGEKEILQSRFGAKRVEVLPNCPDAPKGNETQSEIATIRGCATTIHEHGSLRYGASAYDNGNELREARLEPAKHPSLTLGYLGRIEPNKGMTELLEALKKCKAEGRKFKVRFAGKEQTEGEYLPKFEEALGEDFEYCGLVSGEAKREFLDSLDVFVMPTYFEGLPMSLLETMSYGVVPVVTKVGSIPTVVKDGENGLFIKVKDADSICEALKKLDDDRSLLAKMSVEARKTIQENFSATKYVERLNAIYAQA